MGGTDPFFGLTDTQVVERSLDWEHYHTFIAKTEQMTEFMSILRNTKVSKMSIEQLSAISNLRKEE